jgi:hypothetical protein
MQLLALGFFIFAMFAGVWFFFFKYYPAKHNEDTRYRAKYSEGNVIPGPRADSVYNEWEYEEAERFLKEREKEVGEKE